MNVLARRFMSEPAFALGVLNATLQALQVAALALPGWGHVAIAAVGALVAALSTRQLVTPATASREPQEPQ